MSGGRKRILSPFAGCKKGKAWNKKYMPVKRQNLAETDRGSYYKVERLQKFLDSKGSFYNGNDSDDDNENYNENNEQQKLPAFANSCYKIVSPILIQKLVNDFAVCKHQKNCRETLLLAEDVKAMIHCEIFLSDYFMKHFNVYFITFDFMKFI